MDSIMNDWAGWGFIEILNQLKTLLELRVAHELPDDIPVNTIENFFEVD